MSAFVVLATPFGQVSNTAVVGTNVTTALFHVEELIQNKYVFVINYSASEAAIFRVYYVNTMVV